MNYFFRLCPLKDVQLSAISLRAAPPPTTASATSSTTSNPPTSRGPSTFATQGGVPWSTNRIRPCKGFSPGSCGGDTRVTPTGSTGSERSGIGRIQKTGSGWPEIRWPYPSGIFRAATTIVQDLTEPKVGCGRIPTADSSWISFVNTVSIFESVCIT